jgi:hypothetical protein
MMTGEDGEATVGRRERRNVGEMDVKRWWDRESMTDGG